MPSSSSASPNVSRELPRIGSVPTSASIRPKTAVNSALMGDPVPMLAVAVIPRAAIRKYSGAENRSAKAASAGVTKTSAMTAPTPARNDPMAETLRAAPALPCRANW